ncbi:MAG: uncharacterized membrane protein YuzA (DUF378 family) [Candidatus Azotimanducaceae bacterium]|jgi:uncharacterized membrane protein YuzA (DUF378 family)
MVTFLLVIVGAINWGLVGLFNFDLVNWLFVETMDMMGLAKIVYVLVGLSAVYELVTHKGACTHCKASGSDPVATSGGEM